MGRFLNDREIKELSADSLDRQQFAEEVCDAVRHVDCPYTMAILGDWGSGKTSVMQLVKALLEADTTGTANDASGEYLVPVWFNAWEYACEEEPIYALLHAIREDYRHRCPKDVGRDEFARSFAKAALASSLAIIDVGLRLATKKATGEALTLEDVQEQIEFVKSDSPKVEQVLGEWEDNIGSLKKAFYGLLETYGTSLAKAGLAKESSSVRFVILVDDLDRCLPESAVTLLEGIRNYLDVENAVFLLGLNASVIYNGIRTRYQDRDVNGREYIEKIVNYAFYLPEPSPDAIEMFVTGCTDLALSAEPEQVVSGVLKRLGELVGECRLANPRRIKRVINRCLTFCATYQSVLNELHIEVYGRLLIVAECFPDLFLLYRTYPETAQNAMSDIGSDSFHIVDFEQHYSVPIGSRYHLLCEMREAFSLSFCSSKELLRHVDSVFAITRMV